MTRKMILIIHFNTWLADPNDKRLWTKEWIDYRVGVFMNYTYRSFMAQTNQDFLAMVMYADQTEPLVRQALAAHPPLAGHVRFVPFSRTKEVIYDYIAGSDEFYLTRIDSDDMYHRTMMQQLFDARPRPETEVIINQLGYCYDAASHQLAVWRHQSPPFHTLVYKTADYLAGKRYKVPGGHPGAIKLRHETIADRHNYVVVIHGRNTATPFSGTDQISDPAEVDRKLREYWG